MCLKLSWLFSCCSRRSLSLLIAVAATAAAASTAFADGALDARAKATPSDMADFAMPPAGRSLPTLWVENSSHAADHVAAGDFQARTKEHGGWGGRGLFLVCIVGEARLGHP